MRTLADMIDWEVTLEITKRINWKRLNQIIIIIVIIITVIIVIIIIIIIIITTIEINQGLNAFY